MEETAPSTGAGYLQVSDGWDTFHVYYKKKSEAFRGLPKLSEWVRLRAKIQDALCKPCSNSSWNCQSGHSQYKYESDQVRKSPVGS